MLNCDDDWPKQSNLRNQVDNIDEKRHKKPQPASGGDGCGTHPNVETNALCQREK
jgi:hypothetical protein